MSRRPSPSPRHLVLATLAGTWMALLCAANGYAEPTAVWREARPLMGTLVEMQVEGAHEDALRRAADAAYREMQRLADIMSHYDPASTVSEINRQAGIAPVPAPAELREVLRMARRVSEATDGAFDVTVGALPWEFGTDAPRVPDAATIEARRALVNYRDVVIDERRGTVFLRRRGMRLDLGGIAKLYILDAGMRVLRRHGIASAMINGGGDVIVIGARRAAPWRIGIRDPRGGARPLGVVELRDGFVVSSGDYERYVEQDGRRLHHILDPRTGRPSQDLAQVTLVAARLEQVNGYGPALMVVGYARARALLERLPGVEALLVRASGETWWTRGFRALLAPAR